MKVVQGTINEPAQAIIDRYEGKTIKRPMVNRWEEVALEEFGIKVEYIDEAQQVIQF